MEHEMKEYVFLVDKSISMYGRESDVLSALNQHICSHQKCRKCAYVTLGLFSDQLEVLYIHNESECVRPVNRQIYYVEGSTALYDAVCEACHRVERNLANVRDDIKKHVEIYVFTDGKDNASVYHDGDSFAREISRRLEDGWKIHLITPSNEAISWDTVCKNI